MAGECSYAVSALQYVANGYHDNSMSPHHLLCASGKGGGPYMKGGGGGAMYLSLSLWWVGEVEVCGGCMCVLCNSNSFIVLPQYWLMQDFQAVCRHHM